MAHFAKLDFDNRVIDVIVVSSSDILVDGIEDEDGGIKLCQELTGHQKWKQTSYTSKIRNNFAGIGFTYDQERDAFIPPKSYISWILDEDTCTWQAPTPMPVVKNKAFSWDEEQTKWIESVIP